MEWLQTAESIMNNPTFGNIANGLFGSKSKPAPPPAASVPVISVQNPMSQGMSTQTMMMIGGGVLALVAVLFFAMKKR